MPPFKRGFKRVVEFKLFIRDNGDTKKVRYVVYKPLFSKEERKFNSLQKRKEAISTGELFNYEDYDVKYQGTWTKKSEVRRKRLEKRNERLA